MVIRTKACSIHIVTIFCVILVSIANDVPNDCRNMMDSDTQPNYPFENGIQYCGGAYTDERGAIKSPNYWCSYSTSISCVYNISMETSTAVLLQFTELDFQQRTGCKEENISIYSGQVRGSPILEVVCANQRLPFFIIANNPHLSIVSHSRYMGLKFQIQYYGFDNTELDRPIRKDYTFCQDIVAMAMSGTIGYSNSQTGNKQRTQCKLFILPSKRFRGISLTLNSTAVNSIDTALCDKEWISITSTSTDIQKIICGSNERKLSVNFVTNGQPIILELYSYWNENTAGNVTISYTQYEITRPKMAEHIQDSTCISHDYFNCDRTLKNACIPISNYCDGKKDCPNGFDEKFCSESQDYFSHFHGKAMTGTHSFAIILGLMLLTVVVILLPYFYYRKHVLQRTQHDHHRISPTEDRFLQDDDCEEVTV